MRLASGLLVLFLSAVAPLHAASGETAEPYRTYRFAPDGPSIMFPASWKVREHQSASGTTMVEALTANADRMEVVKCLVTVLNGKGRLPVSAAEREPVWAEPAWRDWLRLDGKDAKILERGKTTIAGRAAQRAVYTIAGAPADADYSKSQARIYLSEDELWMMVCGAAAETAAKSTALYEQSAPVMDRILNSFAAH